MDNKSQLEQLGLFDARVPRYTSYPTAPHFKPDVTGATYRSWLQEIPENSKVSLYVHVPFCSRLCWFCACRTQGTRTEAPLRAYAEVLLQELRILCENLPKGIRLSRLHWGGGTPTLLPADVMARLVGAMTSALPLDAQAEFSVEIDPNEIDAERLGALAEAGLTRASIGIQDFDPEIQKAIGREQSFETTARAVSLLRAHDIESLNADILFGLPGQDRRKMSESVQKLLALSPDRIALYGYAHVPWVAKRQVMIPAETLPGPEERLELFETARALFLADGYEEIGIDHFARPGDGLAKAQAEGRLRRNFQGYTDDAAQVLIGLGASSISHFPQGYAQNDPATRAYTAAIRSGAFPTLRGHVFSAEDQWRARMIEALMCDFRISATEMSRRFGLSGEDLARIFAPIRARFGEMIHIDADGLAIVDKGRPLTRMIAQMFDAYDMASAGHSTAI
ncbi:oxygen-independent coproporphyrinogen III oxidase [Paracoccus aminophilus]|uniref:Coproporphyrinogen-III oxidase n=1 Tax=Paracoccus aminophilus JCM 7686 TaxID=1367847 RepID=S5XLU4_PARAH|nr:oxygen-independent coproporphyrinogen III oxidase [Paracoccus aminophilus]AGT08214.1 oxygen-independent coproporphyrinogen III oxidase [Paracoccus aminophilus JCM 7686]